MHRAVRPRDDVAERLDVTKGPHPGEFVVVDVDTTLHCLHVAMTQASVWYSALWEAGADVAVDCLADTLMMLVGKGPAGR